MAAELHPLPAIERLSPRCIRILGGNPGKFTLQGTNTYLLGSGKERILIDTGEGRSSWVTSLKSVLEQEKATVTCALISHWHHDHTGGIADLRQIAPYAKVYKFDPAMGEVSITKGQIFRAEGATLTAHHTPGHTHDHLVFVLEEEDSMFTADNVLGHGTAVFEDLAAYLKSLELMRNLFQGRAYPGHGPVVENGPARIDEYIEHRRLREEQVLRTMREPRKTDQSSWAAMDIVEIVYRDVPPDLHAAACGGVLQILTKLQQEGKVVIDDERWRLKDRSTL